MTIHFAPVDEPTSDLLSLVADTDHFSVGMEWAIFTTALIAVSLDDGWVRPNDMRPMLAGKVAPRRVGSFYRKACLEGLTVATNEWQTSDDAHGRNVGKPARCYRRTQAATAADPPSLRGGSGSGEGSPPPDSPAPGASTPVAARASHP